MALGPNMPSFIKAIAGAGIVFRLLGDDGAKRLDKASIKEEVEGPTCNGHIELRDVSFTYDSRPDRVALSNINLEFQRGTCTAVVGPSGAGKSTFIALLERWYQPTSGSILLDGNDVSELGVKWLRKQIALVQQEPQLFNASIFDNIAHGLVGTDHENAPAEEKKRLVEYACDQARVSEFVQKLPDVGSYTLTKSALTIRLTVTRVLIQM